MPSRIYRILKDRPKHQALIKMKGGAIPVSLDEVFERVFWKSTLLSNLAAKFWKQVVESGHEGFQVKRHLEWRSEHGLSVGQYYRMIRGLVGTGMIYKKEGCWIAGTGFLRELEQIIALYATTGGWNTTYEIHGQEANLWPRKVGEWADELRKRLQTRSTGTPYLLVHDIISDMARDSASLRPGKQE